MFDVFGGLFDENNNDLFKVCKQIEVLKTRSLLLDHLCSLLDFDISNLEDSCFEVVFKGKSPCIMLRDLESQITEIVQKVKKVNSMDIEELVQTKEEFLAKKNKEKV